MSESINLFDVNIGVPVQLNIMDFIYEISSESNEFVLQLISRVEEAKGDWDFTVALLDKILEVFNSIKSPLEPTERRIANDFYKTLMKHLPKEFLNQNI